MNPVERIREAKEILESLLSKRGSSVLFVRCHRLIETALDGLFQDADDVAAFGQAFPDEEPWHDEIITLSAEPPRPGPAA
jgi:hypothetical protein